MAEKSVTKSTERKGRAAAEPSQELDAAAGQSAGDGQPSLRGAAKSAAVTALAAAVAGALGGAAKAMLDRRDESGEDAEDDGAVETSDPEDAAAPQPDDEQEEAEQQPRAVAEEEDDGEAEQDEDADAPLSRDEHFDTPEPEPGQGEEPEPERGEQQDAAAPEPEASDNGRQPQREPGAPASEAAAVVERAKQQLRDVLGNEAESVSGLERSDGRWTVLLEVVEVRRIPESTDVLASYELVLDDDGGIVGMQRRHRYRRSQVEEG